MRRRPARVASDWLAKVEACLDENDPWRAKRLLHSAHEAVQQALGGWQNKSIGVRYDHLVDACRIALSKPCSCLYCGFTDEQRQEVKVGLEKRVAKFNLEFDCDSAPENNFVAAYAEAVFSVHSALPINLEAGGDGGVDFCFRDGMTVDVKGTRYGKPLLLKKGFISKPDHVFVYIQVRKGEDASFRHAFFLGFAYGSDEFKYRRKRFPDDKTRGLRAG